MVIRFFACESLCSSYGQCKVADHKESSYNSGPFCRFDFFYEIGQTIEPVVKQNSCSFLLKDQITSSNSVQQYEICISFSTFSPGDNLDQF
jgi:hypothetical protein